MTIAAHAAFPNDTMSEVHRQNLNRLLKDVSRSFYLTLRVLPRSVRAQIGLAYLLARTTDTIADTQAIAVADRLTALGRLRSRILGRSNEALDLSPVIEVRSASASFAELALLAQAENMVHVLNTFASADQTRIRSVLDTITSGQELDLQRFAGARTGGQIAALRNDPELDDYTYRVAGCVGEFWTQICRAHLFPKAPLDDVWLLRNGLRFGQGLQLVNILRDVPSDLRLGRCYLPLDRLAECGLRPVDLLDSANEVRFRKLYENYLDLASEHLKAGWEYTNALPFRHMRLRLACAWPLLIGAATLTKLRASSILEAGTRIKISRREVRRVVVRSVIWYPWPQRWMRLFPLQT
ncbi:MAG: squalene/phytoene synthase family protein [Verrucomicrobiales bacterium]|nr:squalene/phytoene synthase family protein [Verrucomicrobiales bacterium]